MRKTTLFAAASVVAMTLGTSAMAQQNATVAQAADADFQTYLARGYADLAGYELNKMKDYSDGNLYGRRADAVNGGASVEPVDPKNFKVPDASVKEARARLMTALNGGGRTAAPLDAALAQTNYDCWVEQLAEGYQIYHILACKKAFYSHLEAVEAALVPAPVETRTAYVATEEQATVYFDFDKSNIRPDARSTIDNFIGKLSGKKDISVLVTGHTDASGSNSYNEALSARRAESVRQALLQEGIQLINIEDLELRALGETELAVPTADGVREQANRRVVMQAYAAEEVPVTPGS